MIYVTHDQIEAMTMADKIVVLRKGVVEQIGAPLDLYNRPHNLFVAGFIGSPRMNFVSGNVSQDKGRTAFAALNLPPLELPDAQHITRQGEATLGVRPEDFVVSRDPGNGWPIKVGVTEQYGANSYLHCTLGDDLPILVHEAGQSQARSGDVLYIAPRTGQWHLFDAEGLAMGQAATGNAP